MAGLFSILVDIAASTARFESGMDRVDKRLQEFGESVKRIGEFVGESLFAEFVKSTIEAGAALERAAVKAGTSGEAFSELAYAAKGVGVGTDQLSVAMAKMQKTLSDASSGMRAPNEALRALGLTFDDLKNLKPEEQLEVIADRISKLQSPADRTRAAIDWFGRSGADLLPMFEKGAQGIRAMRDEAQRLGASFSDEMLQKMKEADDSITRLETAFSSLAKTLVADVAPSLSKILDQITALTTGDPILKLQSEIEFLQQMQAEGEGFLSLGYRDFGFGYVSQSDISKRLGAAQNRLDLQNLVLRPSQLENPGMDALLGATPPGYAATANPLEEFHPIKSRIDSMKIDPFTEQSAKRLQQLQDFLSGKGTTTAAPGLLLKFQEETSMALEKAQQEYDQTKLKLDELFKSGKIGLDDFNKGMTEAANKFNNAINIEPIIISAKRIIEPLTTAQQGIHNFVTDVKSALASATQESGSFGRNLLRNVLQALENRLIFKAIDDIGAALARALSSAAQGGGIGGEIAGAIGAIWGGLSGGGDFGATGFGQAADAAAGSMPVMSIAGQLAGGGSVSAGSTYLVGEQGPELFTAGAGGVITPNSQLAGMGGGDVHIHMGNIDARGADADRVMTLVPPMIQQQIAMAKHELLQAFRRTGLPAPSRA